MPVTLDELQGKVSAWLAPISAEQPAGANAKFDPRYEAALAEVAKLESPAAAGTVDWKRVVDQGGEILKTASKDLLLASYVGYGWHTQRGFEGLADGMTLVASVVDGFWPVLFPELKRLRGRAGAVGWFVDRALIALTDLQISAKDRPAIEALSVAAPRLAEVVRDKFGQDGPAMRPLLEAIERARLSLPEEAPPPPPAPPTPEPVQAAPTPTATPAPTAAPAPTPVAAAGSAPSVAAPSLTPGVDPTQFLRECGTSIASVASEVRRGDGTLPLPYRLLRTGLYLHIVALPATSGGKSPVPAPPANLRTQLERMIANAKWPELLEEAEAALMQHRFWLDLHRIVAQALGGLGASHAAARQTVVAELGHLARRFPTWRDLAFNDGTPAADGQTKAWLDEEVQLAGGAAAAPAGSPAAAGADDEAAVQAEVRKLIAASQIPEALARLQTRVQVAPTHAARFRARLALARVCADTGQLGVARALFESLDGEVIARGLEEWDPALASSCLEAYSRCLKMLAKGGKGTPSEASIYDRLCRLDPGAALRLGA